MLFESLTLVNSTLVQYITHFYASRINICTTNQLIFSSFSTNDKAYFRLQNISWKCIMKWGWAGLMTLLIATCVGDNTFPGILHFCGVRRYTRVHCVRFLKIPGILHFCWVRRYTRVHCVRFLKFPGILHFWGVRRETREHCERWHQYTLWAMRCLKILGILHFWGVGRGHQDTLWAMRFEKFPGILHFWGVGGEHSRMSAARQISRNSSFLMGGGGAKLSVRDLANDFKNFQEFFISEGWGGEHSRMWATWQISRNSSFLRGGGRKGQLEGLAKRFQKFPGILHFWGVGGSRVACQRLLHFWGMVGTYVKWERDMSSTMGT